MDGVVVQGLAGVPGHGNGEGRAGDGERKGVSGRAGAQLAKAGLRRLPCRLLALSPPLCTGPACAASLLSTRTQCSWQAPPHRPWPPASRLPAYLLAQCPFLPPAPACCPAPQGANFDWDRSKKNEPQVWCCTCTDVLLYLGDAIQQGSPVPYGGTCVPHMMFLSLGWAACLKWRALCATLHEPRRSSPAGAQACLRPCMRLRVCKRIGCCCSFKAACPSWDALLAAVSDTPTPQPCCSRPERGLPLPPLHLAARPASPPSGDYCHRQPDLH